MISMKHIAAAAFATALTAMPVAAFAEDLELMLTNLSSRDLYYFQTSPSGVDAWEEDILGESYLPAGNTVPLIIADGRDECVYDLRFTMDDDSVLEAYGYDLCETEEFTLYDED